MEDLNMLWGMDDQAKTDAINRRIDERRAIFYRQRNARVAFFTWLAYFSILGLFAYGFFNQ